MTSGRSIVDFQVGRQLAGSSKQQLEDNKNELITTHDSKLSPPRDVLKVTPAKDMNSMKLVIPLHSLYWSIHTKDESIRGTAFAFIFGVN